MLARCRDSAMLRQAAFDDVIAGRNTCTAVRTLVLPRSLILGPRFPILGPVPGLVEKRGARWPTQILKLNISDWPS
jgi:hypothetical protein